MGLIAKRKNGHVLSWILHMCKILGASRDWWFIHESSNWCQSIGVDLSKHVQGIGPHQQLPLANLKWPKEKAGSLVEMPAHSALVMKAPTLPSGNCSVLSKYLMFR